MRLLIDEMSFKEAFSQFPNDGLNGLSPDKLKRLGQEAEILEVYDDATVTCRFDDGVQHDMPLEAFSNVRHGDRVSLGNDGGWFGTSPSGDSVSLGKLLQYLFEGIDPLPRPQCLSERTICVVGAKPKLVQTLEEHFISLRVIAVPTPLELWRTLTLGEPSVNRQDALDYEEQMVAALRNSCVLVLTESAALPYLNLLGTDAQLIDERVQIVTVSLDDVFSF